MVICIYALMYAYVFLCGGVDLREMGGGRSGAEGDYVRRCRGTAVAKITFIPG